MEHPLYKLAPIPLSLVWHENKSTYLSIRKEKGRLSLRLHCLFYKAPTPVLKAIIRYALKKDASSFIIIKQMAHLYFSKTNVEPDLLNSCGAFFDLKTILDRVSLFIQPRQEGISIGFSKRGPSGKGRSITFGSYDAQKKQIRINPILDQEGVPLYFVEFVVYHEMLHALLPSKIDSRGRIWVHTKEFREKEKLFPEYNLAKEWEEKSLEYFKRRRKGNGRA